jgi:hypothetical protein
VNDTARGRVLPAVRVCDAVCCAIREGRGGESPYPMLGLGTPYELHVGEDPAMLMKFLFLGLVILFIVPTFQWILADYTLLALLVLRRYFGST